MDELIGLAIDALRAKNAQGGQPWIAAQAPPPAAPRPAPTPRAAVTPKASPPAAAPSQAYRGPLHGLFEGGNSLVRAVVAAELLDRPLALRENAHWQKR